MDSSVISVRVNTELRDEFTEVCGSVGLEPAEAMRRFMKRAILLKHLMPIFKERTDRQEAGLSYEEIRGVVSPDIGGVVIGSDR